MTLPGLAEQKFIIFVNGFERKSDRAFLNYPNVKVIRWNYPHEDASPRELMLAAFVLGVAQHVKTDYWMKLDADTYPVRSWWDWPDYEGSTVFSHRWGYTKMKGDTNPRHWFNRLDDVFRPDNPYFQHTFDESEKKIRHNQGNPYGLTRRFASFCHMERTDFTRRIAERLNEVNQGRLVIPSQDTTSWYCSMIWGEKVKLMNMKQWFRA